LLNTTETILHTPELGFFVELFARTTIKPGDGNFARSSQSEVVIAYSTLGSDQVTIDSIVAHELYHVFNYNYCPGVHGALDEGSAIFILKYLVNNNKPHIEKYGMAEAVFGTKLWYAQIGIKNKNPKYPWGS